MYKVQELAQLAGVSARTLRYYDQIGLLHPAKVGENGYRLYGSEEVDRLQQILFYRQLGLGLEGIRMLLDDPTYDRRRSLEEHLLALRGQQEQLNLLIRNVEKTLSALKGECRMSDKEKFEGFKAKLIRYNEEKYGAEVAEKYGRSALEESNRKLSGMSEEQWQKQEQLVEEIFTLLEAAMKEGDPAGAAAQKAADLHRRWICLFWKDDLYHKDSHRGLAEMYVADERFTSYYDDRLGEGGAKFLRDAIFHYTK